MADPSSVLFILSTVRFILKREKNCKMIDLLEWCAGKNVHNDRILLQALEIPLHKLFCGRLGARRDGL